jgi:hypothetical protein
VPAWVEWVAGLENQGLVVGHAASVDSDYVVEAEIGGSFRPWDFFLVKGWFWRL